MQRRKLASWIRSWRVSITNIGLAQQKMRAHLELNTQAIDDYECYIRDEDGGAPPMRSEGTALPVFDEMRP